MVLELFNLNKYLNFNNPLDFYGFIAVLIGIIYVMHSDLGILE
jgi:hypothetical protein